MDALYLGRGCGSTIAGHLTGLQEQCLHIEAQGMYMRWRSTLQGQGNNTSVMKARS